MDEEITRRRSAIQGSMLDNSEISASLITNFREALAELQPILMDNVAITVSNSIISEESGAF